MTKPKPDPLHSAENVQWIVLFDAVGTILYPDPPVIETYFHSGQRFGSSLSSDQITSRFAKARADVFQTGRSSHGSEARAFSLPSSDSIERDLWFRLVQQIFDDVQSIEPLFDELWHHFANPEHWREFNDVGSCFEQLKMMGAIVAIASNFDSRLIRIARAKPASQRADHIFYSSQIGARKPDPRFYEAIQISLSQDLSNQHLKFAMVGDDLENDCRTPSKLGWLSWCLDRKQRFTELESTIPNLSVIPKLMGELDG